MTKARSAGGVFATVLVLLAVGVGFRALQRFVPKAKTTSSSTGAAAEVHPSVLYGRITTRASGTYEGRLRFGGDEEAFWGDYFNGYKKENPWAAQVLERLPKERHPVKIFGLEIGSREVQIELGRPFMTRFGDIARIEAVDRDVRVTLKSGTMFTLNRSDASDFDDGVRVWDGQRGVRNLDSLEIRTIELLGAAGTGAGPHQLHGTVRTRQSEFTGFVQWNRQEGSGHDQIHGRSADREMSLRFDTIRSIARRGDDPLVTLLDGREIVLAGAHEVGDGNRRGIYVDDRRYGRVLISWDAFERLDFSVAGSGPAYGEFPPGRPLAGSVTTRAGRRLAGRLVYDLDESETTETLDAPSQGVDYTIPFGLVASIERGAPRARVTFHSGEQLQPERSGDLGERNGGMLIFVDGQQRPEYVPWTDIQRIDFDRPAAMYPPLGTPTPGRKK